MDFASDGDLYQKIVKAKKDKSYFPERIYLENFHWDRKSSFLFP